MAIAFNFLRKDKIQKQEIEVGKKGKIGEDFKVGVKIFWVKSKK